jgi:hypothetical protein
VDILLIFFCSKIFSIFKKYTCTIKKTKENHVQMRPYTDVDSLFIGLENNKRLKLNMVTKKLIKLMRLTTIRMGWYFDS